MKKAQRTLITYAILAVGVYLIYHFFFSERMEGFADKAPAGVMKKGECKMDTDCLGMAGGPKKCINKRCVAVAQAE